MCCAPNKHTLIPRRFALALVAPRRLIGYWPMVLGWFQRRLMSLGSLRVGGKRENTLCLRSSIGGEPMKGSENGLFWELHEEKRDHFENLLGFCQ